MIGAWRKLEDVAQIAAGVAFAKALQGRSKASVPVFKVGDISRAAQAGQAALTESPNHVELGELKGTPLPAGTVVFAKIGEALKLNRRAILGVTAFVDNNVMALVPRGDVIDSRYLYYFMRTVDLGPLSQATTVPSVRKSDVKEISVPVPMVDIQQKVVGEIEKQFTRLAAAAQALQGAQQKLRRYRASSINRALADLRCPTVPLKETVELITKGTTPTSLGFKYTHSGVRFVKVESLSNGRINHERCVSISVEADAALRRSRLQVGDVLFSIAGTLGRVAIVVDVDLPANTNQAVAIIRPTHSLNCRFLAIALTAPEVASAIGKLRRGVGLSNLNLAQIGDMTVKVPSLEVQLRFIEEVETRLSIIDNLDVHLKAEVKRVESLRQSILRGAFRGELSDEDVMHGGSLEH